MPPVVDDGDAVTAEAQLPDPSPGERSSERRTKHWALFVGLLAVLGVLGFILSIFAMLPLAMATDGCHGSNTDAVCTLSARGQNVLVYIPWMCLGGGTAAALAGALIAARLRRTPLIGLAIGMAAYFAIIPLGYWLAFQV